MSHRDELITQWDVLDWRRQVSRLYAQVRASPDPANGHARWVEGRDALLRGHPASPVPPSAREFFPGADVAGYDPAYRYVVPVHLDVEPETREVATGTDGIVCFDRVGRVRLPVGELDLWWLSAYGGGLFLPVKDTGGRAYGGGRYVLDTVKGADLGGDRQALVIDLNFAYQPSCAYDEAWACPLAGPSNTLAVTVPVGEQYRPAKGPSH